MSALVFGLSLTGALLIVEPTPTGRQAANYAAQATYRASGYDQIIEPKVKELEQRYIPEVLRKYGVTIATVQRLAVDHKIEYGWSF